MIRTMFGFGKFTADGSAFAVCRKMISRRARGRGRKMDFITLLLCIYYALSYKFELEAISFNKTNWKRSSCA